MFLGLLEVIVDRLVCVILIVVWLFGLFLFLINVVNCMFVLYFSFIVLLLWLIKFMLGKISVMVLFFLGILKDIDRLVMKILLLVCFLVVLMFKLKFDR